MRAATLLAAVAGALLVAAPAGGAGGPTVFVVDNAFVRDVQRPTLRISSGTTVTWAWRSQQSHGVRGSGPRGFASAMRSRGSYRHTFTAAGAYRIVCPLHAPGMKMTVVVRR